jgi:lipopolysaccharide heptosyltransferase II
VTAPPRRALILKPCCLGDVLLATPLLASLAAAWPEARIDWAVDRHSRPALAGNAHLTGCLDATHCLRGDLRPGALLGLARAIRRGGYDAVFVPDRSPLLAWLAWLARVPLRVGLDSAGRGRRYTVRVAVEPAGPVVHEAELYLDLARALGLPAAPPRPVFQPSTADRAAASQVLVPLAERVPRVALHPGGGMNPGMTLLAKRWPAERYAQLADRLVAERGAGIVLLGGPDEQAVGESVWQRLAPATRTVALDLTGRLTLGETAAVIAAGHLYVGNDSGIAHLAVAVGTPVVAVFGPTDPRRYGPPPGTGLAVAPPAGAVEQLSQAIGSRVIEQVTVPAVWQACDRLLNPPPTV